MALDFTADFPLLAAGTALVDFLAAAREPPAVFRGEAGFRAAVLACAFSAPAAYRGRMGPCASVHLGRFGDGIKLVAGCD